MCWLLHACDFYQVTKVLATLGFFTICMAAIVVVGIVAYAEAKAKHTGMDTSQIDKIIDDARRRAHERGYDGT